MSRESSSRVFTRGGGGRGGAGGGGPPSSTGGNNPVQGGGRSGSRGTGSASSNQRDRDFPESDSNSNLKDFPASSASNTNVSDGGGRVGSGGVVGSVGGNGSPGFGGTFSSHQQSQPGHSQQQHQQHQRHNNPQPQQQLDHQQQQPGLSSQQQQQQQGRHAQPSRPLYHPKPRGGDGGGGGGQEKNRGGRGGGGGGNFEQSHGQNRDGNNSNRQPGGGGGGGAGQQQQQPNKGHSGPRDNARNPQKQRPAATSSSGAPSGGMEQQSAVSAAPSRHYDPVSSRETSSIDTQDNDDALHGGSRQHGGLMGDSDRENRENHHQPQHFPKTTPFGSGQIQNHQQMHGGNQAGGRREQKGGMDGGIHHQPQQKHDHGHQKPRGMDQSSSNNSNRAPQMKVLQSGGAAVFSDGPGPFGKSSMDSSDMDRENDSLAGPPFGQYKNGGAGGVGILSHAGHGFSDESMNMYGPSSSSSKQPRYFPSMGDMGHADKGGMNDRGFQGAAHDSGDIFSKDVFWRGPEREEKRDVFLRDDSSPVIAKSMIWSNQSTTPITHPQPESPHFNRPLMPGPFGGVDPGAFGSNVFVGSPSSMMDAAQMVDPVGHHQRMMQHTIPMNQTFQGMNMAQLQSERMHSGERMFNQQGSMQHMMGGGGAGPMRPMGFLPQHSQYTDAFMPPMGREPGRLPPLHQAAQQLSQQQMGNSAFMQPNHLQNVGGMVGSSRSPHTLAHQEKWGGSWEESTVAPPPPPVAEPVPEIPPPKAPEPVEDFGEFKVPALKGAKNFDNLCTQWEEIRQAIQGALKEFVEKPHKERLRRVLHLCFTLFNVTRDAILLDNVQSCAKERELDQKVWREGFYPVYFVLRTHTGKSASKSETAPLDEAISVLLSRAMTFYNDLIPRVLHPFGGSVTAQTLVNILSAKGRMADHQVVSLQLAERLLTYQGDIYRYQAELPGSDGSELNWAKETYKKACQLSPFNGRPHCQLALVGKRQNRPLDTAFHAIRALSTKLPCLDAEKHLGTLWVNVEKTFDSKKWAEEKNVVWNDITLPELLKRFQITFLAIHGSLYSGKYVNTVLTTQGMQFLSMLEAMLNKAIPLPFRDVLLHMMAINIYRMSTLQADSHGHTFLMDLSFNMFDVILGRLLRIFDTAPDLDSAAHLEDTTILSPVVKVFVEWIKASYQKWFPLSPSLLSAPKDTKRTGMWSRLVSLVNLSLTLNVAGVSEERFPDSQPDKLYEDLSLAGMQFVHPTMQVFYRETRLHETIAEPRFRFKKLQPLGQVLLSVTPPVARLQWNRFNPTDSYLDKNVKLIWAPLEIPSAQPKLEPLPVMPDPRVQEQYLSSRTALPIQPERPDTSSRWKSANPPVSEAVEQAWPSLGQSTKLLTDERRERARTASTNSGDDGRGAKNGDSAAPHESMRNNVEPWWLMDKRLRSNEAGAQLKLNGPVPDRHKAASQEISSKQYFLVDTNVLIDHLDRLEKKVSERDNFVVLVPGTVYRELWKLHQGKNLKAHFALSFISDTMEHNKGRLMVITSKGDSIPHAQLAKREVVIERGSNDDIILRTCLTLIERGLVNPDDAPNHKAVDSDSWRGSLLLVTSDVNMRLKAKKENIYCGAVNDILSA